MKITQSSYWLAAEISSTKSTLKSSTYQSELDYSLNPEPATETNNSENSGNVQKNALLSKTNLFCSKSCPAFPPLLGEYSTIDDLTRQYKTLNGMNYYVHQKTTADTKVFDLNQKSAAMVDKALKFIQPYETLPAPFSHSSCCEADPATEEASTLKWNVAVDFSYLKISGIEQLGGKSVGTVTVEENGATFTSVTKYQHTTGENTNPDPYALRDISHLMNPLTDMLSNNDVMSGYTPTDTVCTDLSISRVTLDFNPLKDLGPLSNEVKWAIGRETDLPAGLTPEETQQALLLESYLNFAGLDHKSLHLAKETVNGEPGWKISVFNGSDFVTVGYATLEPEHEESMINIDQSLPATETEPVSSSNETTNYVNTDHSHPNPVSIVSKGVFQTSDGKERHFEARFRVEQDFAARFQVLTNKSPQDNEQLKVKYNGLAEELKSHLFRFRLFLKKGEFPFTVKERVTKEKNSPSHEVHKPDRATELKAKKMALAYQFNKLKQTTEDWNEWDQSDIVREQKIIIR